MTLFPAGVLFAQEITSEELLRMLLETIQRIDAIQQTVDKVHGIVDVGGVPLPWVIGVGTILTGAASALWLALRASQKRELEGLIAAKDGTIKLLTGKIEAITLALKDSAATNVSLTAAIHGQKEALYKLRDNQIEFRQQFLQEVQTLQRGSGGGG
jgi:hypothetical protein